MCVRIATSGSRFPGKSIDGGGSGIRASDAFSHTPPSRMARSYTTSATKEECMRANGAIVIGGDYGALGVVRSLGRRGIPVWVLTNEHRVATASRYVRFDADWPRQPAE